MIMAHALQGKPWGLRLPVESNGGRDERNEYARDWAEVPLSSDLLARLLQAGVTVTDLATRRSTGGSSA